MKLTKIPAVFGMTVWVMKADATCFQSFHVAVEEGDVCTFLVAIEETRGDTMVTGVQRYSHGPCAAEVGSVGGPEISQ